MDSKNSKTSDPCRRLLNLTDKIDLKRKDKYIALSNLSIYYTWKNIKTSYKNKKFKTSAPTWNEEFELPDGSYSISDIVPSIFLIVPNKSFGQFIDISPKNFIFLKTFDSEFSYIEVWFTDQNSGPLDIEGKINITFSY